MPSRSVTFKVHHGDKGEILDNDDTWLELVGFKVTEFVLHDTEKMELATAKAWFASYLQPTPSRGGGGGGGITISAVFSLSSTDIKWQLWPIETTADWRNWIRGCADRKMPPVAVVEDAVAAAKAPQAPPKAAPAAGSPTAALEITAYTKAEQHAREIIARVDAQMNLLTVGASISKDEHYVAWQRVGGAATKMLACLRPASSSSDVPPQQPQANYPSSVPGYQPVRPPPLPPANVRRGQPPPQANTYKGLGVPPGLNPRQTNQPAPAPAAPPPAPANQAAGAGCGQPAVGQQGAVNITALDSASSTSATSPIQRGTPPELTTPQNHKAAAASSVPKRPGRPPGTGAKARATPSPGQWLQSLMVAPQGTTMPCWVPPAAPAQANKRAKPNPTTTTTRPTAVGAAAAAAVAAEVASPAPATGEGSGAVGGI